MRVQLNGSKSFRNTLTAVTAVLVGGGLAHAAGDNKLQSSLLLYSETDRVQAAECVVSLDHTFTGERTLHSKFTFDALTGPSPNGATPSSNIQTFTRPSGSGSYSVGPGEIPLDDTFRDTRISFDGTYSIPLDRLTSLSLGGHFSTEHDYSSFGANAGLSKDFNRKNTNLSLSGAFSHDIINPEGGLPIPLSPIAVAEFEDSENESEDEDRGNEGGGNESKNVFDAILGLTQVIDRNTLVRINYSLNHTSGYLNDPYKIVSLVQSRTGSAPGEPVEYYYESRPGSRTKHAVFAEVRRYIHGHTLNLSYRYFRDDWGITSHTADIRYRFPIKGGHALQPHLRWYRQTEADFYRSYLIDGSAVPPHVSSDYRLAPFHAVTVGLRYLFPIADKTHFSLGAEYYYQVGDISPPSAMGPLSQFDLFPELKAIMVRAGLSYDF